MESRGGFRCLPFSLCVQKRLKSYLENQYPSCHGHDCDKDRMNDPREDHRGGLAQSATPEAACHQNPVVCLPVELQAALSLSRLARSLVK